jgi:glycosyl-4,4'-diaponeurosporenoate acyltransferase
MVGYAVVANAPCLIVQRYNRGRLERILARRAVAVPRPTGSRT